MSLTAGIVGLPNVGKSTLFNAITKQRVLSANYPFATIEPNVGVVEVPDSRLAVLFEINKPKSLVSTTFEFTDIAGLVQGASKGEGLGNKFLSHIREVDAICEVVRCFDDDNIIHVEGNADPKRDIEIIDLEFIFSDLEQIQSRLDKIEKKALASKDKDALFETNILHKIKEALESNKLVRNLEFSKDEIKYIKNYNLLTAKPIIYVANIKEEDINKINEYVNIVKEHAKKDNSEVVVLCAKIESELSDISDEEKKEFFKEIGIENSGLDNLIKASYSLLNLATYFTAGPKEVRAWTFKNGMKAPECAGIIHTDFERGFIRAEVISFSDMEKYRSEKACKDNGKMRLEGKEYIMRDGDICFFRFNI